MIYEQFLSKFTDWRPSTLYWQRFSIAERYGIDELMKVHDEIFDEANKDYKLLTELAMILNHKSWEHCENIECKQLCDLYSEWFHEVKDYAVSHLKNDELSYFLTTID